MTLKSNERVAIYIHYVQQFTAWAFVNINVKTHKTVFIIIIDVFSSSIMLDLSLERKPNRTSITGSTDRNGIKDAYTHTRAHTHTHTHARTHARARGSYSLDCTSCWLQTDVCERREITTARATMFCLKVSISDVINKAGIWDECFRHVTSHPFSALHWYVAKQHGCAPRNSNL